MRRHEAAPTSSKRQDSTALTQPLAGAQPEELKGGPGSVRRQAIADALQEWIVPLLVRRFLDERSQRVSPESPRDDAAGAAQ
jgi:hypothetical protein